jgi:ABC-type multidrug transport system fused ATPase/permease subunit
MNTSVHRFLLIFSICAAWSLISWAAIYKYLNHGKATAAMLLGILFIALGMQWLDRLNQQQRQISCGWLLLLFLIFAAAFSVLYPISLKHTLNIGSDREDALRIELDAVRHDQYPYDTHTFLGNPPTPLPGAMLLTAPFFVLGHIAWQNFLWLALFFVFTIRFFRRRATALFFLAVCLLLAPGNLSDFTSGGDYLTNFFYVAIAVALFIRSLDLAFYVCIPAALFLGVTLSSRIIYLVILIPLLALTLQRTSRSRTGALFVIVLIAAATVTLPIFAPHPFTHLLQQLDQNAVKLRYIPSALHPRWTLPLLAVFVACTTFFLRMSFPRLLLNFSITSFVMLAPFVVTFALHSEKLRYNFAYLSVCTLSFSLWALSRYERISIGTLHNT